jgi:hypothetical protein
MVQPNEPALPKIQKIDSKTLDRSKGIDLGEAA